MSLDLTVKDCFKTWNHGKFFQPEVTLNTVSLEENHCLRQVVPEVGSNCVVLMEGHKILYL